LFFDEFDGIASKNTNLNLRATMLDLIIKSREIPNLILERKGVWKDCGLLSRILRSSALSQTGKMHTT
jgi:hypothetical protein